MKKRFLKSIRNLIKKQYPKYSKEKLDEIMYGVEGIYLTITKTIIIFILAFILGIAKNLLFLLLTFNFIRLFAFGMHANNSITCLIFSSIIFLLGAFACKYLVINNYMIYILYTLCIIIIAIFSPADTVKRPLIKKRKRIKFKILSIIVSISYLIISLIIKNTHVTNYLIIGLIIECILINPLTYKIFKMPYNNYKNYGLNT
ncbi:MAG: accessory gene regulator B family protein [Bacilli bacterium]|nr:accessory gene regulator B family protein [Bacilli bacterium]